MEMARRQVHLDFHTSELIPGIGENFSKEQFQKALKEGHVNSITVFSKCHHGWAYHPSKANKMHPNLKFDLLKAQIEAAHEIGVKTPVYLSAGLDEKLAREHPDWLVRNRDESTIFAKDFNEPGYHLFCMNSPYLDVLLAQIKEVCENYDDDGIFLDITGVKVCYCQNCIKSMREQGFDPYNEDDVYTFAEKVFINYCKRVRETIDSVKPGDRVFHNGGHIRRGKRDFSAFNSHLELESLPTGGWGYDHFPLSAAYTRTLGMDFLGMTGKFHETWGEFGGFKHPNALRYEMALSSVLGAKCSIGDQMHPDGEMNMATYKLIGTAYKEVEDREEWLDGAKNITEIAVLSAQAVENYFGENRAVTRDEAADIGVNRMLLECHYLYDVIDVHADFGKYKVIILPDSVRLDDILYKKLRDFVCGGGKILATGKSGLYRDKDEFTFDLGAEYIGENEYNPDYIVPEFDMEGLSKSAYVMYSQGQKIKATGTVYAQRQNPYFNRTVFEFSSHKHTPNKPENVGAGITEGADGAYIAWNIFTDYAQMGSLILKRMFEFVLDTLMGNERLLETNLPSQGVATLTKQEDKNRMMVHLLFAVFSKRGENIDVVEDSVPLYNTKVCLKTDRKIKKVYMVPENIQITFKQENGKVLFTVDKFETWGTVALEY